MAIARLATCLLLALLAASPAPASVTVNVEMARSLAAQGDHRGAAALLEEALRDEPTHATAQFLMGVCRLNLGDVEGAERAFGEAGRIDPSLRDGVAEAVSQYVLGRLGAGDVEAASRAFEFGIRFQPAMRVQVGKACVDKGAEQVGRGEERRAQEIFRFASERDVALRERICDVLYARARESTGEESLRYILVSLRYGDKHQEETGKMVLHLANQVADEQRRAGYLRQASQVIPPATILRSSVDYYSQRWGPAQKLSLEEAGRWVNLSKTRGKGSVRYLCGEHFLTRGELGPQVEEPALEVAGVCQGRETPDEKGYADQLWFAVNRTPTEVYLWVVD